MRFAHLGFRFDLINTCSIFYNVTKQKKKKQNEQSVEKKSNELAVIKYELCFCSGRITSPPPQQPIYNHIVHANYANKLPPQNARRLSLPHLSSLQTEVQKSGVVYGFQEFRGSKNTL